MKIIKAIPGLSFSIETCASIGFFDGVHSGHRFLIKQVIDQAKEKGLASALITFPAHPRITLKSDFLPEMLTTSEEKLRLLNETGIDYCFLLDFSRELSQLTAEQFIRQVLCKQFNVRELLIGYDHRFGKDRQAGFEAYLQYGKECGIQVHQALESEPVFLSSISSTSIRNHLSRGEIREANQQLGYAYGLEGKVVQGNKLGRTIDYPTANIEPSDKHKIIPGKGIYAVWAILGEERHPGMAYIGHRPTLSPNGERRIEVNIIDFSGDLYGQTLRLEFVDFIREDKSFNGLDALQEQLGKDKKNALEKLRESAIFALPK